MIRLTRPLTAALVVPLALILVDLSGLPPVISNAQAANPPAPDLKVTLYTTSQGGTFRFVASDGSNEIVVGSVPTLLNITVINNDPTPELHTFTIDDPNGNHLINLQLPRANSTEYVNTTSFVVNSTAGDIQVGNETISPFNAPAVRAHTITDAKGKAIEFYCIPHQAVGMVGRIRVGVVSSSVSYPGFQLWAFWIGTIAMLAMIAFIGVSYFVIKTSTGHHTDEREHIRRGLP